MRRDAALVDRTLREFATKDIVPAGVFQVGDRTLVTRTKPTARYAGGPGLVRQARPPGHQQRARSADRVRPAAQFAELDAFRDPTYPFKAATSTCGTPPTLAIDAPSSRDGRHRPGCRRPGHVEGPGTLALRYLLIDPADGHRGGNGEATPGRHRRLHSDPRRGRDRRRCSRACISWTCGIERRGGAHHRAPGRPRGGAVAPSLWRPLAAPGGQPVGVLLAVLVLLVVSLGATGYSDRILGAVVGEEMRGLRTCLAQTIQ